MKKVWLLMLIILAAVALVTSITSASETKYNKNAVWEDSSVSIQSLTYPSLPPDTYDIVYDTEQEAYWGPILTSSYPQNLRVKFTPSADGQLVREARIAWNGPWGGNNTFEIHLVDADTGETKKTSVITEPNPWDWKVYDVSSLGFYTSGDFYIEFWAIDAEIGIYVDDSPPLYYRSEVNRGAGWYYPPEWQPSDFKIRAVVSKSGPSLILSTDKALYAPGETIQLKVNISNPTSNTYSSNLALGILWPTGTGMNITTKSFTMTPGMNIVKVIPYPIPNSIFVENGDYEFTGVLTYNSSTVTSKAPFTIQRP